MADKDTITLKVAVDSRAAAAGLQPLNKALHATTTAADKTEQELAKIGGDTAKIKINDDAIDQARKEIGRLRAQVREDLRLDIDSDTRPALARIGQLKRTIKALDDETVEVDAHVNVEGGGGELQGLGAAANSASGPLGKLFGTIDQAKLLKGGIFAGVAAAAGSLVKLAGDAETANTQLATLAGGVDAGAQAFADLNQFAADTPFEFDEISDAARQLLAAGISTGDLPKNLLAIGDAASAVGSDIGEVALAYSQMFGKGKVSNEEMLQLQERGIDAYGILARRMGTTVAEVQRLASENKLGLDAVNELRKGMEETYGGSMQRQADTLNGKLSTLGDNFKLIGTSIGNNLLPLMKDLADTALDVAGVLDTLIGKQHEWQEAGAAPDAGFLDILKGELAADSGDIIDSYKKMGISRQQWVDLFKHGDIRFTENQANAAKVLEKSQAKATAEKKKEAAKTAEQAAAQAKVKQEAEATAKAYQDSVDELRRMAQLFGQIGEGVRARVSFIFDAADVQEEIDKLTKGKKGIDLPAHLRLDDLGGLGDKQQQLVETISGSVESGLQEGARRAELNPNFDEVAWYQQVRRKTKGQLIQAGIDPKDINRVLTNVFGLPRTIPVDANLDPAQAAVNAWHPKPKAVVVDARILMKRPTANKPSVLDILDQGKPLATTEAPIKPTVDEGAANSARTQLSNVAAPGGEARTARLDAKVSRASIGKVDATLDKLAKDRHMTIFVHTKLVGSQPGAAGAAVGGTAVLAAPTAAPTADTRTALRGTAQALTGPAAAPWFSPTAARSVPAGGGVPAPAPVAVRPRQTPVAVFLDGAEIADRLELRRSLAAVESVRRTA